MQFKSGDWYRTVVCSKFFLLSYLSRLTCYYSRTITYSLIMPIGAHWLHLLFLEASEFLDSVRQNDYNRYDQPTVAVPNSYLFPGKRFFFKGIAVLILVKM